MKPEDIKDKVNSGQVKPQDSKVIGRVGGHSFVMDDGDIEGNNKLIRFRTTAGHQITMSDTGNFFYIVHANGLAWIELGAEGTLDVYAINSINLRTQGDINLHANRDINMYAGGSVKIKAEENVHVQSTGEVRILSDADMKLYSKALIGIKSDGTLGLQSGGTGSWSAGGDLVFSGAGIDLNGPAAPSVSAPNPITKTILDDTSFSTSTGWNVKTGGLTSIVSRAPTHEPYPYHNKGVDVQIELEQGTPTPPPGAVPVPAGVEIARTS
jgi:FtsP/CotA-like multicopper oxidase with cupredoxin domain